VPKVHDSPLTARRDHDGERTGRGTTTTGGDEAILLKLIIAARTTVLRME